jgi:hypothetical protein
MKRPSLQNTTSSALQNQIATYQAAKPVPFSYGRIPLQGVNWISDSFDWHQVPPPGGIGSPYEFCSVAGAFCQGPIDFVGKILINGVEMANLDHVWTDEDGDYIEYTFNGSSVGGSWYMRLYRGSETQAADDYLCTGTQQNHPPYRGLCYAVFHNIDLGAGNTYVPQIEIEVGRMGPAVGTYSKSFNHPYGVNGLIAAYGLLTDDMGGLDCDADLVDPTFWATVANNLESQGIANRTGAMTFLHPVLSDYKDAASAISEWLAYFDGYLYSRNGQLRPGWFPHQDMGTTGLQVISEQDLVEVPSGGGFLDWNGGLSDAQVTFLDVNQEYTQQGMVARAPANRETQVSLSAIQVDRPLCHAADQAAYIAGETANSFTQDDTGTTLKIFRSRAVNTDGSPLLPGDVFNWVYDPQEIDLVVRVVEREETSAGAVTLSVIIERGSFPQPYVAPIDARVLPTVPQPEDVTAGNARIWVLPSGFGSGTNVTALINRAALTDVGLNLFYSPTGASPWQQIGNQTSFAAMGALSGSVASGPSTLTIVSSSPDMARMQAQSSLAQADDTLLLLIDDEVFTVGSITAVSANTYELAVIGGRQGSSFSAHTTGAQTWLINRKDVQSFTNADFFNVYDDSGNYSTSVATKYFQAQLYTISVVGTATPAAPGIAVVMPDPGPGAVSDLAATGIAGAIVIDWVLPKNTRITNVEIAERSSATPAPAATDEASFTVGAVDTYTRTNLTPGAVEYYWIRLLDVPSGYVSAWIGPVSATVLAVTATILAGAGLEAIETSLNGKNHVFYQSFAPSGEGEIVGDIWFDTAINSATGQPYMTPYVYQSSGWVSVQDGQIPTLASGLSAEIYDRTLADNTETLARESGDTGLSASITAEASIRESQTGSLAAEYVLNVNVGGYIAGYRVTNLGGGAPSNFVIEADVFEVVPSGGGASVIPFIVEGGDVFIDKAVIKEVDAGAIIAGTIMAALTIQSPTITGGGLYINSGVGMRYVDDDHVLTITGGSDNGVSNGAQLDLAGNGASGIAGDAVLSSGNAGGATVRLRTGNSVDALVLDGSQNATLAGSASVYGDLSTGGDIHLGTVQGIERWIYDYQGNHVVRPRYSPSLADSGMASGDWAAAVLQYHGLGS